MLNFETRLTGGHPNSLGNTVEIVEEVLKQPESFDELFNCYFSIDEVVRLRTSNAMKRIVKVRKDLLIPYIDRFLNEIAEINQASTQWTLSSLFDSLFQEMSSIQIEKAKAIMTNNLSQHTDWIVLNTTIDTLYNWSKVDNKLQVWLIQQLQRHSKDSRKSVSKKANKLLSALTE